LFSNKYVIISQSLTLSLCLLSNKEADEVYPILSPITLAKLSDFGMIRARPLCLACVWGRLSWNAHYLQPGYYSTAVSRYIAPLAPYCPRPPNEIRQNAVAFLFRQRAFDGMRISYPIADRFENLQASQAMQAKRTAKRTQGMRADLVFSPLLQALFKPAPATTITPPKPLK